MKNESLMKRLSPEIVFGVQYYRAPTPPNEEWEKDIEQIRRMGFNAIQLRAQWRWYERKEGKFCWDDFDRLFDLAEKNGLKIVFKFLLETAPAWLFKKYDCIRIDLEGKKILPGATGANYIGGWKPCFDHPKVREEANRFIKSAVRRYRDRENLLLWNAWNEPRSKPTGECCCEESKEAYRKWLKDKFKTIERLNTIFGKAWGSFDEIEPPAIFTDYVEIYLWRQWSMSSVADRVKWVYAKIGENDNDHLIMTHVGSSSVVQDILWDTSNDMLNSKEVDFYGCSLPVYHASFRGEEKYLTALNNDWIRSNSSYYWVHELYPNNANWATPVSREEVRFRIWTSISHGAKGIFIWQYKSERFGNESNGFGLVNIDSSMNERADEVACIAKVIEKNKHMLKNFIPEKSKTAIVYDPKSDLISRLEEPGDYVDINPILDYKYKIALKGAYSIFWLNNMPVDWIPLNNLDRLTDYPMVYLPYPVMVSKKEADFLKEYVGRGGYLISEPSPALREENTWVSPVIPGYGLYELFGCKESLRVRSETSREISIGNKVRLKSDNVTVEFNILNKKSKVIGFWSDNKKPAIVLSNYQKGKAMLLGTCLGVSFVKNQDKNINSFFKNIIKSCGLTQPLSLMGIKGSVSYRILTHDESRLIFIFNYGPAEQHLILKGHKLIGRDKDLICGENLFQVKKDTRFKVPSRQVVALLVQRN